jgi:SWI/SNF-related matrix-associated actin-dependent regulator of chromatin subfamily D
VQLEQIIPESAMYTQLQATERRLDALIMRKRMDIQDSVNKPVTVGGTYKEYTLVF